MGKHQHSGFTLIELSIVLVIIGLIVGGVLVGQDLISASRIRAAISQMESFKTAVYTFKTRYNALPGDLTAAQAQQFGMASRSVTSQQGDGVINVFGAGVIDLAVQNEHVYFWADLASAKLIGYSFSAASVSPNAANDAALQTILPMSKLGKSNYVSVISINYLNYFYIQKIESLASGSPTYSSAITPLEAQAIDTKMDDGQPSTGSVEVAISFPFMPNLMFFSVFGGGSIGANVDDTGNTCVNANVYNVSPPYGALPACGLTFPF